tara:strand:- start:59 stop:1222 length:1164 start_codon:yes stop_codon:yes gene_type:complete
MSSITLSSGVNVMDLPGSVPSGDVGISPNSGDTGVFVVASNAEYYTSVDSGSNWVLGGNVGSSGTFVAFSGSINRIYVKSKSDSTVTNGLRAFQRVQGDISLPVAGVAYTTIESLSDVPDYAIADAGKYLAINSTGDEIEFVEGPSGGGGGSVTYNTTADFVLDHEKITGTKNTLTSIAMNDANAQGSSGYYSALGVTGAAISIPAGSRIVGMHWRLLECFVDDAGYGSYVDLSAVVSFGSESIAFPITGAYSYTGDDNSPAYNIENEKVYRISKNDSGFNFTTYGATDSNVDTVFTANANYNGGFDSSSVEIYEQVSVVGAMNGSDTTIFTRKTGAGVGNLTFVNGGINHAPDESSDFNPVIHIKTGSSMDMTLSAGMVAIKFIYI